MSGQFFGCQKKSGFIQESKYHMDLTSMYCLPTAKRKTTQTPLLNVLLTSRRNPKQNKIPNSLQPMVSVLNISCLKYLTMIVHLGKETPKWHFSFSVDLLLAKKFTTKKLNLKCQIFSMIRSIRYFIFLLLCVDHLIFEVF